jgi:hypothetical protein
MVPRFTKNYSRPRYSIEQLLRFLANTLALLRVFFLHLAYGLLFSGLQRGNVHLRNAGQCTIEAR